MGGLEQIFPFDDSYITLTAARNIAQRNLFAVNSEAPMAGITSPLHVAMVGFAGKIISVEMADRAISLVSYIAVVLGAFVWAETLGADVVISAAAGLVTAVSGRMAFNSLTGLETVLFAALIVWSFVACEIASKKPRYLYLMGVLVGLAILTRPEGWFMACAIYSVMAIRRIRTPRALVPVALSAAVALLVVSPYLFANYKFLGSFFPSTVSAKKYFFAEMCRTWQERFSVLGKSISLLTGPLLYFFVLALWPSSFMRGIYPLLFIVIFYLSYLLQLPGALGHYWGRYQHPLLPILIVGMAVGAGECIRVSTRSNKKAGMLLAMILLVSIFVTASLEGAISRIVYRKTLSNTSENLLTAVEWIKAHSEPGDLIATHDIGAVSYFSGRKIFDMVGLVNPVIAKLNASQPDLCHPVVTRSGVLYKILKKKKPKIIFMIPEWDAWFLNILGHDNHTHLEKAFSIHVYQNVFYDFYLCNWNGESPAEEQPKEKQ